MDRVASELATAYREIADARSAELGGSSVRYPHLEIFKVRALAAYRARVNDPVVDRVIAEIAQRTRPAPFRIELALGAGGWQASSESPFRMGNRRFYVMLVKPEGAENEYPKYRHMEEAWGMDGNPFPADTMRQGRAGTAGRFFPKSTRTSFPN